MPPFLLTIFLQKEDYRMKLGFVSAILPKQSYEEVVDFASDAGFSCVEMMCWPPGQGAERRYAGVTHVDAANLTASEAERLVGYAADRHIEISGLGYYPNVLSGDEEEAKVAVDQLYKVIDAADMMNVSVVNTFLGRNKVVPVEESWAPMEATWEPILAHAASKKNIKKICFENCRMYFTKDQWPGGLNLMATPNLWRQVIGALRKYQWLIGINFDPSHFIWQFLDYLAAIREFGKIFGHVHAKDARIDWHKLGDVGTMAHPLDFHTPKLPGLGDVDWGAFFSELTDVGYAGAVCVEVEDRAYEGSLAMRKEALMQSLRFLRQFVPIPEATAQ